MNRNDHKADLYILSSWVGMAPLLLDQEVIDFDANKGYASVEGYTDLMREVFLGEREPPVESTFRVCQGWRHDDLIAGTIYLQYFMSKRMSEALFNAGVTGFRIRPETVYGSSGEPLPYGRLIVSGRCGELVPVDEPVRGQQGYELTTDLPQEDICVAPNVPYILVNRRVVREIRHHKLKVRIRPLRPCEATHDGR